MGAKIRQFREQLGMTQKELAEALGLQQATISFWENGKIAPSNQNLIRLADILGCKPGDLFG